MNTDDKLKILAAHGDVTAQGVATLFDTNEYSARVWISNNVAKGIILVTPYEHIRCSKRMGRPRNTYTINPEIFWELEENDDLIILTYLENHLKELDDAGITTRKDEQELEDFRRFFELSYWW